MKIKKDYSNKNFYKEIQQMLNEYQPFEVGRFSISWKQQQVSPLGKENLSKYKIGIIHDRTEMMDDVFIFDSSSSRSGDWLYNFLKNTTHLTTITTYYPSSSEEISNYLQHKHPFKLGNYIISFYNAREYINPDKKFEVVNVYNSENTYYPINDYDTVVMLTALLSGQL